MAHSSSDIYSLTSNNGWDSTETLRNTQTTKMDEHARDARSLNNDRSFDDTCASGGGDPVVPNEAQDSCQSQANMGPPDRSESKSVFGFTNDKTLVCLNLKGKMVIGDYLISCDMLQRFQERYGEGDCLQLAKLYRVQRDLEAFVDYMTKIADYPDRPEKVLVNKKDSLYIFASYWMGWDAQNKRRFQKPGPCIGDHVVLHGVAPTLPEYGFMNRTNVYPIFNDRMIIDRSSETGCFMRHIIAQLLRPESDDDRTFYSLQTLSRLRRVLDETTQISPSQVSINCLEGKEGQPSATWISMSHEQMAKHLEEIERREKVEKPKPLKKNRKYGQASRPMDGSSILSYGQEHSSSILSRRKHDA